MYTIPGILFVTALFCVLSPTQIRAQKPTQPNVLFILTDDQGSIDLNCYGASDLSTPNLDALAQSGTRFTRFYVAAPVCSPSRASLLTGLNPHAAGLPGNASSRQGTPGMPSNRITIAEAFKKEGYTTAHIGKWHLGFSPETMPNAQGFDYSFGHMGGCIDNYSHFFYWDGPNRHDLFKNGMEVWHDGQYFPDLMLEEAEGFIEKNRDHPFFMYYAINMPHYPLQPTLTWREHYRNLPRPRRDYAAFVSTVDERVGQLLDKLSQLGLRDNTIVIFQSDHGHSVEERTFGGGGNAGPFRGAKFSLFEGGIRVPAIISWPRQLPANKVCNTMAFNIDWFPTLLEFCHLPNPYALEGQSLAPIISGQSQGNPNRQFIWKSGISWAIREGDWKLIASPQDPVNPASIDPDKDRFFLANLRLDSTEQTNYAEQYPDRVQALIKSYLSWEYASQNDLPVQQVKINHLAVGHPITLEQQPAPKYKGQGADMLTDSKTGTRNFNDGFWMGFLGNDLEATIDMGRVQPISEISVGALQDCDSYIFLPSGITVSFSNDGKHFIKPITRKTGTLDKSNEKFISRIALPTEDVDARYLRIKVENVGICPPWHPAKGSPAFLFVDEITVH